MILLRYVTTENICRGYFKIEIHVYLFIQHLCRGHLPGGRYMVEMVDTTSRKKNTIPFLKKKYSMNHVLGGVVI